MKKIRLFVIISIILCLFITIGGLWFCHYDWQKQHLYQTSTEPIDKVDLDFYIGELRPKQFEYRKQKEQECQQEMQKQQEQEKYRKQFFKEDVPLSENLQEYIYSESQEKGVQYILILALIKTESNFQPDIVSANSNGTYDIGLFQINSVHYDDLLSQGYDLYDTEDNIKIGIDFIAGLVNKFGVQGGLMAYNMGIGGYYNAVNNGVYSTDYSQKVIENQYCFQ